MYGCNDCSVGYEIISKSKGYSLGSAGDISTNSSHLITNDPPSYAGMFYSPTEHENITDIKYSKVEMGYDSGIRDVKQMLDGKPLEFYVPGSTHADDGVGRQDNKEIIKMPKKVSAPIINEIEKAQKQILKKELVLREVEEVLMIRKKRIREISFKETSIR